MKSKWGLIPGPVLAFCLLFSGGPRVSAQLPEIRTEVDTTVVTVGDRMTMMVYVDHPAASRVVWPDSLDLSPFEVLEARLGPTEAQGDFTRSSLALRLAAFELGDLEIPGFEVGVEAPDGETVVLETRRFGIRVESVGLDESGDIREIRGPLRIPRAVVFLLLPLLVLLLTAAVAWVLYRRFRNRVSGVEHIDPLLPRRPPHEIALEELERLEASPLLERGEVKEYHIRVSEILRTYIEGRFRVPALEMTTRYITAGLEGAGADAPIVGGFGDFLTRCDLVKFAKHRPVPESARGVLVLGRELVETTVPTDPEPSLLDPTPQVAQIQKPAEVDFVEEAVPPPSGGGS